MIARHTDRSGVDMANPKKEKIWYEAVMRAVNRRMEEKEGKPKKLEALADKLVECAMDGEGWAMSEVANRLDGKAHQSIGGEGENGEMVIVIRRFADD